MDTVAALPTLDDLCSHVLQMLCNRDKLDPGQTPMRQSVIKRRGRPCGLFFQVDGPRRVRAYAVWAGEEDRILYYDCNGARIGETQLSEGPDPLKLAG